MSTKNNRRTNLANRHVFQISFQYLVYSIPNIKLIMECHYKILGIDLEADDDVIKKAYRKAALKYHPDKNPDSLEEATERFRLVQAAYDVLSDPQERAWYDRHREEILHRKKYENYKNNSIDLFDYFTPSAYKGFGDDDNGFYSVYRDVFIKINSEDEPFRSDGSDNEDNMPVFGDGNSNYDDVVHSFYSSWQAYSTSMSFVWVNRYDVKEAPNRRVARIIEKENKKERDKHKKVRNELVRELVAFVRKRDPRVKAHKVELEKVAMEQARKAEERRASAIHERVKEAALYDESNREEIMKHHERVAELEGMMKHEFGFTSSEEDSQGEEEEEYKDELFCVACNKLFKSEMGLRNHKKSKKHRENVNRLQQEMKNEVMEDEIDEETLNEGNEEINDDSNDKIESNKLSKKQKKQRKQQEKLLSNMMSSNPFKVEDFEDKMSSPHKPILNDETANDSPAAVEDTKENFDGVDEKDGSLIKDDDNSTTESNTVNTQNSDNASKEPNTKKNKNKRQKQTQSNTNKDTPNSESLGCGKCNRVFHSRNKLFQHLKQTGHSLPLEDGKTSKRSRKKK
uniref:dnaJ homolog subfamily C member 21-like n=1 Tax=Styela clava TaxID=7725 RepID=UPI00193A2FE5|nr:dnaJ homolog subfamily C member 21-like [Styela clava]